MSQYNPYIIPKISMAAASINNILCTRAFPFALNIGISNALLRPIFVNLNPNYKHVIAVQIDNTEFCYIALQGDAWFLLHEALENIEEEQCATLPQAFKQAILESLATPILKKLNTLLDVNINLIESYVDINQDSSDFSYDILEEKHARISFALNVKDYIPVTSDEIFFDIWIPKHYNANIISNKLMQLPIQERQGVFDTLGIIPLNLSFEIGFVSIFKQSLLNLECGNILLPDKLFTTLKADDQGHLKLILGNRCTNNTKQIFALCSIENNQVEVLEAWNMSEINFELEEQENFEEEVEETIDAHEEQNNEFIKDTPINIQNALGEVEVMLSFELERRSMLLSDVQDIGVGYTFALNNKPDSPVTLRLNGKNIGQGRLVDMNGLMGVEVIKLVKA